MTPYEISNVLADISYKHWLIKSQQEDGDQVIMQWIWDDPAEGLQKSRTWLIGPEATKSEIVQTALLAALVAEEHETREAFRYKGAKIFGPHFDADTMVEIAKKRENLDIRPEPVGVV